jgi:hypothetical protein
MQGQLRCCGLEHNPLQRPFKSWPSLRSITTLRSVTPIIIFKKLKD